MDISVIDLLYLALAVIGYATGSVLWTYFARPAQEADASLRDLAAPPVAATNGMPPYFEPPAGNPHIWPEAPGTR